MLEFLRMVFLKQDEATGAYSPSKTKVTAFFAVLANVLLGFGVAEGSYIADNIESINTVIVMLLALFLRDGMDNPPA